MAKRPDSKLAPYQRVTDRSKRGIRVDDAERWLRENDPGYDPNKAKYLPGKAH